MFDRRVFPWICLTLTVRLIDIDRAVGTFVLTRGATPSILGCP